MLPRRTPRRACKDSEREWNGFCVDRNLRDEWLVSLNSLSAFNLISICEGHCEQHSEPHMRPPHVKLRLKDHLLPGVAGRWDEHKMPLLGEVNRLSQAGDTYVNLEMKCRLRSGAARLSYQEDLILRIHSRDGRVSEEMAPETAAWFQRTVELVKKLDGVFARLWRVEDHEG
jgi:hypothetical protein